MTSKADSALFVSVIVPVFNDPDRIALCIESLLDQTYPRDRYEILIADNNSTDHTRNVVARYPVQLVVEDKIQSSYAARNRGARLAKGSLLGFTDSDALPDRDWIRNAAQRMTETGADYLGGSVELFVAQEPPTVCDIHELCFAFPMEQYMKSSRFSPTVNMFVKRNAFDEVKGFQNHLISGGDRDFGMRIHNSGFRQIHAPDVRVRHPTRSDWRSLRRKSIRLGKGIAQMRFHFPELYGPVDRLFLNRLVEILPHPVRFVREACRKKPLGLLRILQLYFVETYIRINKLIGIGKYMREMRQAKRDEARKEDGHFKPDSPS